MNYDVVVDLVLSVHVLDAARVLALVALRQPVHTQRSIREYLEGGGLREMFNTYFNHFKAVNIGYSDSAVVGIVKCVTVADCQCIR